MLEVHIEQSGVMLEGKLCVNVSPGTSPVWGRCAQLVARLNMFAASSTMCCPVESILLITPVAAAVHR